MQLNQIFCRYEDISMEQLSKSASLGHTVELAIRTNDASVKQKARNMDSANTYDLIYQLALIPDEEMSDFLRENGDRLALALTLGRTLPTEFNVPIFDWLIDRALSCSVSFLHNVLLSLNYLRRHIITEQSKWFISLLDYGYNKADIMYLNYGFLHNYVDANYVLRLSKNVVSAYFESSTDFDDVQKIMLVSILESYCEHHEYFDDCSFSVNKNNWLFAINLSRDGYLSIESGICRIGILREFYSERRVYLTEQEIFQMIDHDILIYNSKDDVQQAIFAKGYDNYFNSFNRVINIKSLSQLLEIGILKVTDVSNMQLLEYIGSVDTRKKYELFMQIGYANAKTVAKLGYNEITNNSEINLYRSFLTNQENRQFAIKVIKHAYKWLGSEFIYFISKFLEAPDNALIFSKEELLQLLRKLTELFPDNFSMYYQNRLENVILGDSAYVELQDRRFKELEFKKIEAASIQLNNYYVQTKKRVEEILSFDDLLSFATVHLSDHFAYEKTLIPIVLNRFVFLVTNGLCIDESGLKLLILLYQYRSISLSQFKHFLTKEVF
mgnify:FL=1